MVRLINPILWSRDVVKDGSGLRAHAFHAGPILNG
jgi:hypothetical protein